ncbi:MAG: diphosphomevalonate decarboxylase [Chromatiales bacterium]|nr:diphosphomevalonate decarboxylase [Chromatiales bacterium]
MRAVAVAHPNVALVKYWGKRARAGNLPATGSLSLVLGGLATETSVRFDPHLARDRVLLDGREDAETSARVSACLDELRREAGVGLRATVESRNDFPTGAGLASSASGFAALVTAGAGALGLQLEDQRLAEIARLGSGSAPRSLLGGVVLLTNRDATTVCEQVAAPADWPLEIVVAVTTTGPKETSSRIGMALSEQTSPYYDAWVETHGADLAAGLAAVRARDFPALAGLAEHNCLKMHAVMLTTRPPLIYWTPATLACLHRIQEMRRDGVPVFFTVDAGPQVKAVCLPQAADDVATALAGIPGVLRILRSPLGEGARLRANPD